MGIFNLLLAIPLANKYGGIGCAFATGLSMFVGNGLIMNWYYAKVTGLDIKEFWQQITKISVGVIFLTIVGYGINKSIGDTNLIMYFLSIVIYTMVYCLTMFKGFMNDVEKAKIRGILKRFS